MRLINAIKRFFGLEEYEASPAESQPLEPRRLKAIYIGTEKIWDRDEAEPVRYGRWEECEWVEYDGHGECVHYPHEGCVCTNCRNAFKKEFVHNPRVNRCPHCGARMDAE